MVTPTKRDTINFSINYNWVPEEHLLGIENSKFDNLLIMIKNISSLIKYLQKLTNMIAMTLKTTVYLFQK